MLLMCKCLNVCITSLNKDFEEIEPNIKETFSNSLFFNEDLGFLSNCSIKIEVSKLVKERPSNLWRIVYCLNCDTFCYAMCHLLAIGSIVVPKGMEVNPSQVEKLRKSDSYSPIFKIIISSCISSDEETSDERTTLLPSALSWIKDQTSLIEEKVKTYSDKQYAILEELRKRAYGEQRAINRMEREYDKKSKQVKEKKDAQSYSMNEDKSKTLSTPPKQKQQNPKSHLRTVPRSISACGAFALQMSDGEEDISWGEDPIHQEEDSLSDEQKDDDSDGLDEPSYHVRRMRAAQIAKSLPIPVPQFMEDNHSKDPLLESPEVPSDIAASIKALAKSVHGDSVFGELPPPRFSTNL